MAVYAGPCFFLRALSSLDAWVHCANTPDALSDSGRNRGLLTCRNDVYVVGDCTATLLNRETCDKVHVATIKEL